MDASTAEKAYYSVAELEARWGVSRWTVYRLANEGKIKKSRIVGTVRFSAATVQSFEKKAG